LVDVATELPAGAAGVEDRQVADHRFTQPAPRSRPARAAESTANGTANSSHPQPWDHTGGAPADRLGSTQEAFAGHSRIVCLIVCMFEAAARRRRASG
jgi:hypothetical protein